MSSIERAFRQWAESTTHNLSQDDLTKLERCITRSYVVYGDMIILAASLVDGSEWKTLRHGSGIDTSNKLLANICAHMRVGRIAINRPIPPAICHDEDMKPMHPQSVSDGHLNILRSPIHFQPLYGDFGPESAANPPSDIDLQNAYWVTARQNGIAQTWAPRWTMFSRGNISEKARVLGLPSVARAVEEGMHDGKQCSAVDLYAGIGYFAFSYIKAGVSKVLCWEMNAWSCEGLRRGAESNRWKHKTYSEESGYGDLASGVEKVIIFHESNEHATRRLEAMKSALPPVRHVNCGLLPSSQLSWPIALNALDVERGGWIHVHENFAAHEIESRAEEVRLAFQAMVEKQGESAISVSLDFINRVKSYAPGVFHCVLDIYIPPRLYR